MKRLTWEVTKIDKNGFVSILLNGKVINALGKGCILWKLDRLTDKILVCYQSSSAQSHNYTSVLLTTNHSFIYL